jgi:hypothetical protein
MQSRYERVENALSNFSIECFRNKSALNYYAIHEGSILLVLYLFTD